MLDIAESSAFPNFFARGLALAADLHFLPHPGDDAFRDAQAALLLLPAAQQADHGHSHDQDSEKVHDKAQDFL